MNLAFIGPRGVGKSKLSRKLSKMTGMPVVSTDMIAVYELGGVSISEFIKNNNGDWKLFRDLEYSILQKLENSQNIILDCGGGIIFDLDESGSEILSSRKVTLLKKIARIVRLEGDLNYLAQKVINDPTRPSLSSKNAYMDILTQRSSLYKEAADYSINIDSKDVEDISRRVLTLMPQMR